MKNLEEKKISVILILISSIGMIIGYSIKQPFKNGKYYREKISTPLHRYHIDFFGYNVSYKYLLISLLILLGIAIYCFLFTKDDKIKRSPMVFIDRFKQFINSSILKKKSAEINKNYIGEPTLNHSNKSNILSILQKIKTYIKNFYLIDHNNNMVEIEKCEAQKKIEVKKSLVKRLFSYDGRIGRTDFFLKIGLLSLFFYSIFKTTITSDAEYYNDYEIVLLLVLLNILWLILEIKPIIKRLHDLNLPGWVSLLPIIPKQLLLFAFILKGYISIDYAAGIIIIFMWTVPFSMLLLTLIPGSKSQNKYGNSEEK
ncbi:DUF805 domain-containing protein [Flavobacterium sp. F-380]|uniref:DUF805 domain-containing protein n=1 Tax=Flavobacterium kayseriense TaxID=2764714 RepID=A0ABR7J4J1_9FLAO|nr:DUF805 domain-containing protein [Flavobacterium kayseriense]MBC5840445.1 DUF805 domain-containing protein [Flavobacterium kayseriense]MBC5846885.1 DUF805 domain-containing protein [Flavobacterium kayseriense]